MDAWQEQWDTALASDDPVAALRAVVVELRQSGAERDLLVDELHRYSIALEQIGREGDYEATLDVLDMLTGWCGPHARIE